MKLDDAQVATLREALRESRRRLRTNTIAWHVEHHNRRVDFEDCDNSSCTNDLQVLAQIDAALANASNDEEA
jgi:hypothetical protein